MTPAHFALVQAMVSRRPSPAEAFAVAEALRLVIVARHPDTSIASLSAYSILISDPVAAGACRLHALTLAARYMIATPEIVDGEIVWSLPVEASEKSRRELRDLHALALVLSGALDDQASPLVIGPSALDGANRDGDDAEIAAVLDSMITAADIQTEVDKDLIALAVKFPIGTMTSAELLARVAEVETLEASIADWQAFAARFAW